LHMMDMFNNDPELSIATPVMKIEDPKKMIQKFQRIEYMVSMLVIRLMGYMDCLYVAPGPFSVYKLSALRRLGRFDGSRNIEDQEIAWRAQLHHHKIRQCSKAFVTTVAPDSLSRFSRQRTRWFRGSILTIYDYRKIAFNREYGDFGIFVIPQLIIGLIVALIGLFIFLYYILKPVITRLLDLKLVHFDLMTYLKDWKFTFSLLDLHIMQVFLIYVSLALLITILVYASRFTEDSVLKHGSWFLIPYFLVYYLIIGTILLKVVGELLIRKRQRW
jgi:cellulose synthase/poly-beta-1,6-N-acetylglucosamine synthase-like glycosyltransferase